VYQGPSKSVFGVGFLVRVFLLISDLTAKAEEHPLPGFVYPRFSFLGALNIHAFGRWEESGVPGENPGIHMENMQTPHRKAPARN